MEVNCISGSLVEYKWFLAQQEKPALYKYLRVRPLAVSGLLECDDGIVFGLRGKDTTQENNKWELIPSGGIDCDLSNQNNTIPYKKQLLVELREESGIAENNIINITPFLLVEDLKNHVVDIGIHIKANLSSTQITKLFDSTRNNEYQTIKIVRKQDLTLFVNNNFVVNVSKKLIENFNPLLS